MLQALMVAYLRNEKNILNNIHCNVNASEILQIIGPNGVGKTTLLRVLAGLLPLDEGEIFWNGTNIAKQREAYVRDIFYLGHHRGIKNHLTVLENLQLNFFSLPFNREYNQKSYLDMLDSVLNQMNLLDYKYVLTGELSYGQQQRTALAKLLLSKAKLWILDEPFSALDANGQEIVEKMMAEHIEKKGSIIFTSHIPLRLAKLPVNFLHLQLEGK